MPQFLVSSPDEAHAHQPAVGAVLFALRVNVRREEHALCRLRASQDAVQQLAVSGPARGFLREAGRAEDEFPILEGDAADSAGLDPIPHARFKIGDARRRIVGHGCYEGFLDAERLALHHAVEQALPAIERSQKADPLRHRPIPQRRSDARMFNGCAGLCF